MKNTSIIFLCLIILIGCEDRKNVKFIQMHKTYDFDKFSNKAIYYCQSTNDKSTIYYFDYISNPNPLVITYEHSAHQIKYINYDLVDVDKLENIPSDLSSIIDEFVKLKIGGIYVDQCNNLFLSISDRENIDIIKLKDKNCLKYIDILDYDEFEDSWYLIK